MKERGGMGVRATGLGGLVADPHTALGVSPKPTTTPSTFFFCVSLQSYYEAHFPHSQAKPFIESLRH